MISEGSPEVAVVQMGVQLLECDHPSKLDITGWIIRSKVTLRIR